RRPSQKAITASKAAARTSSCISAPKPPESLSSNGLPRVGRYGSLVHLSSPVRCRSTSSSVGMFASWSATRSCSDQLLALSQGNDIVFVIDDSSHFGTRTCWSPCRRQHHLVRRQLDIFLSALVSI